MSEPINKRNDISSAPTPQNTPASVTNSYLRSQPPTVSTITEEDGNDVSALMNNPALMSMIQGKLSSLVGQDSGYVEQLPKAVKNRVGGLKAIQQQQMQLEAEFQKELLELEKKYFKKYEPLYVRRKEIVVGDAEPTAEEIAEGRALLEDEEDDKIEEVKEEEEEVKGVPGFWLTALLNLQTVAETITERDSDVLDFVTDIRMEYLESPGFKLIFEFNAEKNPFFTNKTLSKSYYYQAELGYSGDFVYDHAEGDVINWTSSDKNVTLIIERRKQRNKHTKQTRTIEKLTPTESFFNFFDPPKPPTEKGDDEEDFDEDDEDLEARLELDYQLGEEIKDRLIPRAIDWFTGEAVDFQSEDEFDEEDFSGDDDQDDDDDSDEDEESDDEEGEAAGKTKQQPPECKQS
ncbi:hypothetical protein BABINDRAFT_171893 [Babjeviella inositovora NRRL Y-12698]|uniref:Nucleosome assembly protein n=1 Tax=Babjeviella inositovora NRRL Y-12698 TaxID=984486 RepID=A0A1E3QN60_9ASCO|nr:uncharacterized protein BABINDRAFT_171893 [Babjeviella inositovora NRRL Y-12698]ODQ79111.1 hypothetical protein BABINDRAFT_171893 [Babjeviella inositovora NRRL Y-12698]